MTAPGASPPPGAYRVRSGERWGQDKTESSIRAGLKAPVISAFSGAKTNFLELAFGGFVNGIAGLVNALLGGIFGLVGGVVDLVGQFVGVNNQVRNVAEVQVPRLDNRIDELAGGVTQYTFGSTGTFTKPAGATRIAVTLVGGGAGGSRYTRSQQPGGGCGGWTKWYEFLASEVPASVTVTIGNGGGGRTGDGQLGLAGGDTSFGDLLTVGGGRCTAGGAQPGYGTELYYDGSGGSGGASNSVPATAGGNGPFSPGGAPGGAQGANGASPGSDLIGPGSGGGGGGFGGAGAGGGAGGAGGYPGGGGGGGGNYNFAGFIGNGGNGAAGAAWVRVYFN